MTRLAAGYLNRARIARHAKARAIKEQREAWKNGLAARGPGKTDATPGGTLPLRRGADLAPAA